MQLFRMRWPALVGVLVFLVPVCSAEEKASRRGEAKAGRPAIVLRLASLDNLIADARYLVELAGKAEEAKQAEGFLKSVIGTNGLDGIATTRPFGFYSQVTTGIADSPFAVMVPVADETKVLALLDKFNLKGKKDNDGIYEVALPNSLLPACYRFADNYLYATIGSKKNLDKDHLLSPETVFPAAEKGLAALTVHLDQVPEKLRDTFLAQVSRSARERHENVKNETQAQKDFHNAVLDASLAQLKVVLNEGKTLRVALNVDRQAGDLSAALVVTPRPGSSLAETFINLGKIQTPINVFGPDSALSFEINAALSGKLRQALEPVIDEAIARERKKNEASDHKELAEAILKAVVPTLKMAQLDAAANVRGPDSRGLYTVVMGAKVKDGKAIEATARELVRKLPGPAQEQITLDAAKIDGVNIHKLNPGHLDEATQAVFGANPSVYLAISEHQVFVSLGSDALNVLKEVVSKAPAPANPFNSRRPWPGWPGFWPATTSTLPRPPRRSSATTARATRCGLSWKAVPPCS